MRDKHATALDLAVSGRCVRLPPRHRRTRHRPPVEPEALIGSARFAIGWARSPLQVIMKGRADGSVSGSERRLQADQPVDPGQGLFALRSRMRRRATLGLSCISGE